MLEVGDIDSSVTNSGVAGMGYKHLLDKKRSKKSKKKRVSSDKKKTGVGGWGHKLRVEGSSMEWDTNIY